MHDPSHLREQARRCRALSKTAIEPEVIEQLRVWAVELADEADQAEWRAAEAEETIVSVYDLGISIAGIATTALEPLCSRHSGHSTTAGLSLAL